MSASFRILLPSALLACVCLAGCGGGAAFPKTYPVKGKVTVNDKPIEGAVVTFQLDNGKENAIGRTDANGEYTLSMFRSGDGAIPGKYRVAIAHFASDEPPPTTLPPGQIASGDLSDDYAPPSDNPNAPKAAKPKSAIPEKYSNDKSSGLVAEVAAGPNVIDFPLK